MQYVFSVYLIYNVYPELERKMPISQDQLFEFLIPAFLFLFAGVFIFNKDVPLVQRLKKINPKEAAQLGNLLLFISFFFDFLSLIGISSVSSLLSFTFYLRLIGAMCYLFVPSIVNYLLMAVAYATLLRNALSGGVFIDIFMWCTYLFLMISLRHSFSFKIRSSFIIVALPVLILVQTIKKEYRAATWTGKRQSGIGLFKELAEKERQDAADPFASSKGVVNTVGRLNQGWHLGMVLKWVPKKEAFADGDDFLGDIVGTILPRIFFSDKKVIGSQDKFQKYTGHKLIGSTSMTIGVLGDFYINFGRWGAFIGLFIFGAIISRLLYLFIRNHVLPDPINIIWIPFLFSYLIRANNDFYIVINSFVKGYLIFLFVNFLRKLLWPAVSAGHRTQ